MALRPRSPPLDALRFFDAAMRHASFAGAANELNVTPSAVSQRIKAVESALGIVLFERQPHGLLPTEAARLYLLEIRPALERLHLASARVAAQRPARPAGRGRRLSVDMLPALATMRLAPKFGAFRRQFPDVELRLTTSRSLTDPAKDGFDCCIRYGPGGWAGVDAALLASEQIFPICAPALLAGRQTVETLADLIALPVVHDLMPIGWTEWMAALGGPEPASGGPVFSDSAIAHRAAVEGLGVALGRSLLVMPDIVAGRLVRLLRHELPSPFGYWLIRPSGRRDALVDMFADWLLAEVLTLTPDSDRLPLA